MSGAQDSPNIRVLVYGPPNSGRTSLISRWVSGALPSKKEHIESGHHARAGTLVDLANGKKKMVVVDIKDGSSTALGSLCPGCDVIVICCDVNRTVSEFEQEMKRCTKEVKSHFRFRRPPIITLGTMVDLRNSEPSLSKLDGEEFGDKTCIAQGRSEDDEVPGKTVKVALSMQSSTDTGVSELAGMSKSSRELASTSDGDPEFDASYVSYESRDMHLTINRRAYDNPSLWSTVSINGSFASQLDSYQQDDHDLDGSRSSKLSERELITRDPSIVLKCNGQDKDLTEATSTNSKLDRASSGRRSLEERNKVFVTDYSSVKSEDDGSRSGGYMEEVKEEADTVAICPDDPSSGRIDEDHQGPSSNVMMVPDKYEFTGLDPNSEVSPRVVQGNDFVSVADGERVAQRVKAQRYIECSSLSTFNLRVAWDCMVKAGCKFHKKNHRPLDKCCLS